MRLAPLFVIALVTPGLAGAESDFSLAAEQHVRAGYTSDIELDEGETAGGGQVGYRLRLDAHWQTAPGLSLTGQADLDGFDFYGAMPELSGQDWVSSHVGIGTPAVRLDPRHLYLTWTHWVGQLRLGQMGSQWGLGLIANDGTQPSMWGVPRHGDIVERAVFATRPFAWFTGDAWAEHVFLAVGGDVVFRDENAELLEGDVALQGVLSLFYRKKPGRREGGLYLAYRSQKDREDAGGLRASLKVLATDVSGAWTVELADDVHWVSRGELALLTGRTTRLRPDASPDGVSLTALGWAANTFVELESLGLEVGLWAGYASGDNNPEDDTLRRMRFDPEFRPSIVLFDRVLAEHTARGYYRVADPARTNVPQAGAQFLPTGGSVSGAFFVGPQARWELEWVPGLEAKLGLMYAVATADLYDPYASFANGGALTSLYGEPTGDRGLGLELDVGVGYHRALTEALELHLDAEWGHLFPGPAFDGELSAVDAAYVGARLAWRIP